MTYMAMEFKGGTKLKKTIGSLFFKLFSSLTYLFHKEIYFLRRTEGGEVMFLTILWQLDNVMIANKDLGTSKFVAINGFRNVSFLDGSLGYNQVLISNVDGLKTTFKTKWDT